jgi:CelD/BcsL family acetyltransferase involved in cellulose biosynthesis
VSLEHKTRQTRDGYGTGDGASGNPTVLESRAASIDEWQVQTLRDDSALSKLAVEWNDLYERCSPATAFTSHAWLESWWRSYGRPGRLVVVTVRLAGFIVGAAALMRRHRFGFPALTPIGAGISDFSDILLDDSCASEAARRLARELANQNRWHTIDLPEVRDGAAAWQLAEVLPHRTWRLQGSTCLDLPARPMDELIEDLPPKAAKTRRTKRRKIQETGIQSSLATGDEAAAAVATTIKLHRQQWRGRDMNPEHGRERFAGHLFGAVPAMVERGQAHVIEHRIDDEVVAVDLVLADRTMLPGYLYGHRPDLRRRVDVTQLIVEAELEMAHGLGSRTLSMLRGDEPHKRRWRPRASHNCRLLLACPAGLSGMYAAGVRARNQLANLVKTRLPVFEETAKRVTRCLLSFM